MTVYFSGYSLSHLSKCMLNMEARHPNVIVPLNWDVFNNQKIWLW